MKNVFMISLTIIASSIWVLDTGSSLNICNSLQGMQISRWLKKGETNLQVGNKANVAALALGFVSLKIPTGEVLVLVVTNESISIKIKLVGVHTKIMKLKQASRSWNIHFNKTIAKFNFVRCKEEPCVYKRVSGSIITLLVLYVDDILLIGNDVPTMQSTKIWLSKQFSMKDLGEVTYILGIKIYRDRSKRFLGLSQSMYINTILKRYNMKNFKRGYLSIGTEVTLGREDCPKTREEREHMTRIPYASAVGAIMYTMICTRPDVAYALRVASRYQARTLESG
uniref:Retrovirus-related Pol polyprotein from transposon TNT 1-94 n=1 Tax=Cajanus cajan TaxID=3821 RepID=A0A151TPY3_CAJCA|nr:Retrovirus-related Pol polyprotein from transposon TNT 1-94 [Cajanus cajan]